MTKKVNITEERIEFTAVDKMGAVTKQAQAQVRELRSSIDTVKNALAAVGITVGVGAMLALYRDTLKATAALDDFSESTGAAVSTLSALERVAKVGNADFNLVTDSMGKMIKNLNSVGEQSQKTTHALGALGIIVKNTDGTLRDQGEVMVEVAQKLNAYADTGNKTALVQDLYGKGAQKLLPYLKDLADSTDRYATVTKEQAAQAEEAEKNIRRLQLTLEDARRELVVGITPAIIEFTDKLIEASKASGGLIRGVATMAFADTGDVNRRIGEIDKEIEAASLMARTFEKLSNLPIIGIPAEGVAIGSGTQVGLLMAEKEYLTRLRDRRLKGLAQGMVEDVAGFHAAPAAARLAYRSPDTAKKGLTPYDSAVLARQQEAAKAMVGDNEFVSTQLDIQAGKYGKLTEAQKQHLLQLAAIAEQQKGMREFNKRTAEEVAELAKATGEYNEKLRVSAEHYRDLVDPTREYWREQEHLNELLRQRAITQQEYWAIQNKLVETRTKVIKITEQSTLAADAANAIGLSFTSAFDRIIDGSGRSVRALDLLNAAAMDISKVLIARNFTNPAVNMLERGFTGLFKDGGLFGPEMSEGAAWGIGMEMHSGGVVGMGGRPRYVHPAYFERARRMHAGGLAVDEVPAVLQRGEEVLTKRDPRHRSNGGGGNSFNFNMTVVTPNPEAFRASRGQIAMDAAALMNAARRNS